MKFTAKKTLKTAIVGGAVAATALLSACGGEMSREMVLR